ncbi:MAG: hypothetical protein H6559_00190 [Lewinellaceae bacterium]|nr:hypothetical protein [Lewinellaceae bacterium]
MKPTKGNTEGAPEETDKYFFRERTPLFRVFASNKIADSIIEQMEAFGPGLRTSS